MPNYSILVHSDDRSPPQTTYIPQENIEIITDTKVITCYFLEVYTNIKNGEDLARKLGQWGHCHFFLN